MIGTINVCLIYFRRFFGPHVRMCRHTVASSWLPRLLGLVVGDVPAGRAASGNTCGSGVGGSSNGMGEASGNLTKMFITVFNGVVDYMPHSQKSVSVDKWKYGVGGIPGCIVFNASSALGLTRSMDENRFRFYG